VDRFALRTVAASEARRPDDAATPRTGRADAELVVALEGELGRIRRTARLLVGDPDLADDLVGEAIARTLPRWRAGRVEDAPAYVRRVVVNLASRRWRRLALGRRRDAAALEWSPEPTDESEVVAERDRTLRAVMRLPPRRRAVVVLRFYEDMTVADIADVLAVAEGTVKSQLSRALEQLRDELETLEST
jgi:RNA polymerase sigma-70 factor (sigma-E family)